MCKRVLIAVIATLGLIAIWQSGVEAAVCLKYASGSNTCTIWAPKGVQVEVDFKTDCGSGGCFADVSARAIDSVVFCSDNPADLLNPGAPPTGTVTTRRCTPPTGEQFFFGSGGCQDKHQNTVGEGHEHHGCTARIVLEPIGPAACGACAAECTTRGEVCLDLTPIEMDTRVIATAFGIGVDLTSAAAPTVQQEQGSCIVETGGKFPTSTACLFEEHCTINQNRLRFIPFDPESPPPFPTNQKYQCDLTCAGEGCFGD